MEPRVKRPPKDLHEEDFYVWAEQQAAVLRAGRFDELDLENLIEEVEDLGAARRSAVLNNARIVMEHLLKLQHSLAADPRKGWRASVVEHRVRLEIDLTSASASDPRRGAAASLRARPPCRRALAARPWRDCRRRRAARDLPLQPRSDHRRLAAVRSRRILGPREERVVSR